PAKSNLADVSCRLSQSAPAFPSGFAGTCFGVYARVAPGAASHEMSDEMKLGLGFIACVAVFITFVAAANFFDRWIKRYPRVRFALLVSLSAVLGGLIGS